jgi:putative membrane protein
MKKTILTALALAPMAAFAQPVETWHAKTLGEALGYTALFGLVGAIMVVIGFKAFDKIITRIDLEGEIQKGNIAASILAGAVIVGLAIIIAAAMG